MHAGPVRTAATPKAPDRHQPAPAAQPARCLGAATQLAALHRTLAGGLPLKAGGTAPSGRRADAAVAKPAAQAASHAGLPDRLKAGVEALSGLAMDDVRVHRNSSEPATLGAHAFAKGSEIHLGPGQERHLPHEAWHIVQQKQGRVSTIAQRAAPGGDAAQGVNDDPRLEAEATRMGEAAQRHASGSGRQAGRPIGEMPRPRPSLPSGAGAAVQLLSCSEIRQSLIDDSRERTSNAAYRRILDDLDGLAGRERDIADLIARADPLRAPHSDEEEMKAPALGAMEAGHEPFDLLRRAMEAIERAREQTRKLIASIEGARSTAFFRWTRRARNDALAVLKSALEQKLVDWNQDRGKVDYFMGEWNERLSPRDKPFKRTATARPQAGFEMEFAKVWVLDPTKAKDEALQYLLGDGEEPTPAILKKGLEKAKYSKRTIAFSSPEGTWDGTADTTLSECSNLEIVTKPLTAVQWQRGEAAERDYQDFLTLEARLGKLPTQRLLHPAEALPRIRMTLPNARLFKIESQMAVRAYQTQMTAQVPIAALGGDSAAKRSGSGPPSWWIDGLNADALPLLIKLIGQIDSGNIGRGSNPKGVFGGVILKTPMKNILGSPISKVPEADKEGWAHAVAKLAKLKDIDANAVDKLVKAAAMTRKPQFRLRPGDFSWKDYLLGLVEGEDLLTRWASAAFPDFEDFGLGMLADEVTPGFAIAEYRQVDERISYLEHARGWASAISEAAGSAGSAASSSSAPQPGLSAMTTSTTMSTSTTTTTTTTTSTTSPFALGE